MRYESIFAIFFSIFSCSPAEANRPNNLSWGKVGVSLNEYARDSHECAETSRYVTTYIPAKSLRQLDALSSAQLLDTVMQIGASDAMGIVQSITKLRSADDVARRSNTFGAKYISIVSFNVRDQLQAVIDKCLFERGYVPIQLKDSQVKKLKKFRRHSTERTSFLYSIDTDANVIDSQRVRLGN